jgi:cytochrome c553
MHRYLTRIALWLTVGATGLASPASAAPNSVSPNVGAEISQQCATCHGSEGLSVSSNIPNLAGQHYAYLVKQLNAFKSRQRIAPPMNTYAASLSEKQIRALAAFYSSIPIQIGPEATAKGGH